MLNGPPGFSIKIAAPLVHPIRFLVPGKSRNPFALHFFCLIYHCLAQDALTHFYHETLKFQLRECSDPTQNHQCIHSSVFQSR